MGAYGGVFLPQAKGQYKEKITKYWPGLPTSGIVAMVFLLHFSGHNMTTASDLFGLALANAVADRLSSGAILAYTHREYCGTGLAFENGAFIFGEVYDGQLPSPTQVLNMQERGESVEYQSFASRADFVAWLAAQSDDSLSGQNLAQDWQRGNQRLTRQRLQEFIA
ncbi:MAG: hypothetical protein RL748_1143 [Pseudomonadota bacterium]|jgi:hypothetical protein